MFLVEKSELVYEDAFISYEALCILNLMKNI